MRVLGYATEVRSYNTQEKKTDPRNISSYFVGCVERSKGYKFYCLSHYSRASESRNAKFYDNDLISWSNRIRNKISEHDHSVPQPST